MNVLELNAEVIILLPSPYEKECLENVLKCGVLVRGETRVGQLQRKLALDLCLFMNLLILFAPYSPPTGLE